MRTCTYLASFAAMVLIVPALCAQTYEIKLRQFPAPGKKMVVVDKNSGTEKIKISVQGMVVQDKSGKKAETTEYTLIVVEKGVDGPNKYKRVITKAVKSADGVEEKLPQQGKTIVYEKKNGRYVVSVENGAELDAATKKKMESEANNQLNSRWEKILGPGKAVKVGETWKIDPTVFSKGLNDALPIDADKSTVTGKLVKVYKKGNSQFGVLDIKINLAVPKIGPLELKKPAMFAMNITLDTAIDGSSTFGSMKGDGNITANSTAMQQGVALEIELAVMIKGVETHSAEK